MRRKGDDAFSAPGVMNLLRYGFGYSIEQDRDWVMSVGRIVRPGWTCCVRGCVVLAAAAGFGGTVLARPAADAPTRPDPAKVMGYTACMDCHKPEIAAWKASRHAVNFEKTLSTDKAKEYADKVGVTPANITREGMCVDCHGQKAAGHGEPLDHGGVLRVLPRGLRRRGRLAEAAQQLRRQGTDSREGDARTQKDTLRDRR